jgi:beta-glucosidase
MFAFGLFNRVETGRLSNIVTSPAHSQVALKVAESGTVLLKNNGVLPLNSANLKSIAVIGADAGPWARTAGIGSGRVHASHIITPVAAIKARAGRGVRVRYASLHHVRGGTKNAVAQAVKAARSAQVAIVFGNDREKEGADRHSLDLPYNQNKLISAVAAANPRTIVVLNTGGAVLMPWLSHVAGVLEAWYPGQQDGQAAAAVLFGDVDPSGKLPLTFPASAKETPTSSRARWPGTGLTARYSEGLYVGYRWYEGKHVRPLFPFGYGLSYTSFHLSDLIVQRAANGVAGVRFTVANTGHRSGTVTPQLYLGFPAAAGEPPRQLRAFTSVSLAPGQQHEVRMMLPRGDFTYWNTATGKWQVASGNYHVFAGTSSVNLPLHAVLDESGLAGPQ